MSIAVVIDSNKLHSTDFQTIEQVRELVAMAIGTDIEKVSVQSWEFDREFQDDLEEELEKRGRVGEGLLDSNVILAVIITSAVMLLIGLIVIMRIRRKVRLAEAIEQPIEDVTVIKEEDEPLELDLTFLQEQKQDELKRQLDKFAAEQPEAVAQLLRNWLTED